VGSAGFHGGDPANDECVEYASSHAPLSRHETTHMAHARKMPSRRPPAIATLDETARLNQIEQRCGAVRAAAVPARAER